MSARSPRLRLVRTTLGRPHRYRRYRRLTQILTLAVLAVIPLARIARFDVWTGEHYSFGERVGTLQGAATIAVSVFGFYFVTFLVNLVAARTFCGWACPVGQLHRLGDVADASRRQRPWLPLAAYSAALSAIATLWFTDPAMLWTGSVGQIAGAGVVFVALAAVFATHGRLWRWGFCRQACPIGLYYSVVQQMRPIGVVFDETATECKGCNVCAQICPVGLDPRDLEERVFDIGGIAVDDMPGTNHCLHCGLCVEICERVTRTSGAACPLAFRRAGSTVGGRSREAAPGST